MKNIFLNNLYIGLLSLIIPLLILGPAIPDLIITLTSIIFLSCVVYEKNFRIFNNNIFILILVFWFFLVVSSLQSEFLKVSLFSALSYLRIILFSILIFFILKKNTKIIDFFFYSLAFSFLLLIIDSFFQYIFGYNIIGFEIQPGYEKTRISSFFKDELILGSYLSRLLPFFMALYFYRKENNLNKNFEKKFVYFIFFGCILSIFLSGERTSIFFSLCYLVLFFLYFKNLRKILLIIFSLFIIFVSMNIYFNKNIKHRLFDTVIERMYKNGNFYIFSEGHDSLIKTAINISRDNIILGHGPKSFRYLCKFKKYRIGSHSCDTHPHNFYIQVLVEVGIIGLGFLLLFFTLVCRQIFISIYLSNFKPKTQHLSGYQYNLLLCVFITLWPLSPNGNFFTNNLMIIYSIPIGFLVHSFYCNRSRHKKN